MNKLILPLAALLLGTSALAQAPDPALQRAMAVLKKQPVIDGHNDWPGALRGGFGEKWWEVDLMQDSRRFQRPLHTDIPRLHQGQVGGQFWSVYVPASITGPAAVKATIEQIDIVHGLIKRYPQHFELASTAADIRRIQKTGKIASLLGVEGASQMDNSLPTLRMYHALGVRYMTLTHSKHSDWADSANEAPRPQPLTEYGKAVVGEMNRIGMLVDLSHVSPGTMKAVLAVAKAPVIYSHSSARALADHPRNVPDDVLALVKAKGGVVMANFVPGFISEAVVQPTASRSAEFTRQNLLFLGQPDKAAAAMAAWNKANPAPVVDLKVVADHLDHIAKVAGHDAVGLGARYDGIPAGPVGLEGVEPSPALFAALVRRGWSDENLAKLAGGNILRAMEAAEKVAAGMSAQVPSAATVGN
ncbi:dipeptidase [Polymorphobacter multimanifer]|uniref:dipeptidase n=1 Tax=Polymorphobacter multimanifer TaxID=1070431 RepID=UPI00166DBE58|nr:dipeptidase [Polymorphobacter multimanifer]GGI72493.1 dipeptidase [Polymorphobacter multimanifer]